MPQRRFGPWRAPRCNHHYHLVIIVFLLSLVSPITFCEIKEGHVREDGLEVERATFAGQPSTDTGSGFEERSFYDAVVAQTESPGPGNGHRWERVTTERLGCSARRKRHRDRKHSPKSVSDTMRAFRQRQSQETG